MNAPNGIDRLVDLASQYQAQRCALVTNDAATTCSGEKSRVALLNAGLPLTLLFSPEHGLNAKGVDGAYQPDARDLPTGLPIISLYGKHLGPPPGSLDNNDLVFFDIPDIGCRFYTYLWTLTHVMEACQRDGKKLIVLDRPNPTGGQWWNAEGPWLDELNCSSFIGRWNIPVKHGCTLGELARYFAATRLPELQLEVFWVQNWDRSLIPSPDAPNFQAPSPGIPSISAALLYPGTGLLEGVQICEGRGTPFPFQMAGAPWLNAEQLIHALDEKLCKGLAFDFWQGIPADGVYLNQKIQALVFRITDSNALQPVAFGFHLLQTLIHLYPDHCTPRKYITRANPSGEAHLDRLSGIADCYNKLKALSIEWPILVGEEWGERMKKFLIYD